MVCQPLNTAMFTNLNTKSWPQGNFVAIHGTWQTNIPAHYSVPDDIQFWPSQLKIDTHIGYFSETFTSILVFLCFLLSS